MDSRLTSVTPDLVPSMIPSLCPWPSQPSLQVTSTLWLWYQTCMLIHSWHLKLCYTQEQCPPPPPPPPPAWQPYLSPVLPWWLCIFRCCFLLESLSSFMMAGRWKCCLELSSSPPSNIRSSSSLCKCHTGVCHSKKLTMTLYENESRLQVRTTHPCSYSWIYAHNVPSSTWTIN